MSKEGGGTSSAARSAAFRLHGFLPRRRGAPEGRWEGNLALRFAGGPTRCSVSCWLRHWLFHLVIVAFACLMACGWGHVRTVCVSGDAICMERVR